NDEGREALYGLRTPDIDQEDLSKALSQVQSGNGVQSWTEFRVITEGQARKLRPIVHNQVYRIFREALVNAFRHARAARIEVVIDYFDRRLRVACRDNGC
ncbi:MAG TPA: hypothetical protein VEZ90_06645, partial [Blastocatellia bacterium]|nr:hypothetical protein [Blastocatellia bacterium]